MPSLSHDLVAASRDAAILLRNRVTYTRETLSVADCWLLNAAFHVEGRTPHFRIGCDCAPCRERDQ